MQSAAIIDGQLVTGYTIVANGVGHGASLLFTHEHAQHRTHVETSRFFFTHHSRHHFHHVLHAFHAGHSSADTRHDALYEVADTICSLLFMTFGLGVFDGLGHGEGLGTAAFFTCIVDSQDVGCQIVVVAVGCCYLGVDAHRATLLQRHGACCCIHLGQLRISTPVRDGCVSVFVHRCLGRLEVTWLLNISLIVVSWKMERRIRQ